MKLKIRPHLCPHRLLLPSGLYHNQLFHPLGQVDHAAARFQVAPLHQAVHIQAPVQALILYSTVFQVVMYQLILPLHRQHQ
jgi:hypothetical protein